MPCWAGVSVSPRVSFLLDFTCSRVHQSCLLEGDSNCQEASGGGRQAGHCERGYHEDESYSCRGTTPANAVESLQFISTATGLPISQDNKSKQTFPLLTPTSVPGPFPSRNYYSADSKLQLTINHSFHHDPRSARAHVAAADVEYVRPTPRDCVLLALRLLQSAHNLPTPFTTTTKPRPQRSAGDKATQRYQPFQPVACTRLDGLMTSRGLRRRYFPITCSPKNGLPSDGLRMAMPRDLGPHLPPLTVA